MMDQDVKNVIKDIKSTEMENANMLMNTVGTLLNKDIVLIAIDYISLTILKSVNLEILIVKLMLMDIVSNAETFIILTEVFASLMLKDA